MARAVTAKNYPIERAPKRIELLGDKNRRPEPAQHIIEFPGGAIELSRLDDGTYWAHIIVNRRWAEPSMTGFRQAYGEVIASRVGRHGDREIADLERQADIEQIAVLVRPIPPSEKGP